MKKLKRLFQITLAGRKIWKEIKTAQAAGGDYRSAGPHINSILSNLGPTFIKLAQMLSVRPDLIPSGLADQLRALLDHGLKADKQAVLQLFFSELKKTPEQLFENFDPEPFAVASISQVHQATYHGAKVAVKIQKPGIRDIIHRDLAIINMLIPLLNLLPSLRPARHLARTSVDEFFGWIEHELDYRLEALNMTRISSNFAKIHYFKAPTIIHELNTKRILCMEYLEGPSLNDLFNHFPNISQETALNYGGVTFHKKMFIEHARNIVFKQVLQDGYFHADPHPGNLIILPENKIAYIDFGIVGVLTPTLRLALFNILAGLIEHNVAKLATTLINLDEIEGHDPLPEIETKIRVFLNQWQSGSIVEKSTAQAFFELLQIALKAHIDLPVPAIILGKTILEYDGILRTLDPEFDLLTSFEPLVAKAGLGKLMGDKMLPIPTSIKELAGNLKNIPEELHSLIGKLAGEGVEFSVHFGPTNPPTNPAAPALAPALETKQIAV